MITIRTWLISALAKSPVSAAFWLSLMLSLIAISGAATVGKDSAFYLDIAQQIIDQGFDAAKDRFNWPWLMLILAWLHQLTGLDVEVLGYGFCSLLMAGTCALLVACVKRVEPHLTVWAVAAVLSIPAFNSFREDILREYGFWFFSVLALWLGLAWQQRPNPWLAAAMYAAILGAAAFRLEALLLVLALFMWRLPDLGKRQGVWRFLSLHAVPMTLVVLGALVMQEHIFEQSRIERYVHLLDPSLWLESYQSMAQQMVRSVFAKYLDDEASFILLFVLVMTVVLFFIKGCGIWGVALLYRPSWRVLKPYWQNYRLFALAAILYTAVLMIFLVREGFINSRYASFLHLLCVPFLASAMHLFITRYQRLGVVFFVLVVVMALSNVISTSAKKTHYVAAGQWVAQHIQKDVDVYFEDGRIGYYARRGYLSNPLSAAQALSANPLSYQYFAVEAKADALWLQPLLNRHQLKVLTHFSNRKGQTVLLIGPDSSTQ